MNRWARHVVMIAASVGCLSWPLLAAAEGDEEQKLLGILRSAQSPSQKGAACSRLKRIGTARCVPALAKLLADKDLSHSARYALESMPCPEAGRALLGALAKTAGKTRAGIIDSLGCRRERKAAAELAKLLGDPDAMVSSSAATALGRIGGPDALQALRAAMPKAPAAVRGAVADAILLCADRLLAEGNGKAAAVVYQGLYGSKQPEHIRTAAYHGMVLAAGDGAVGLVTAGVTGSDRAARLAALPFVRRIEGQAATKAFAALLAKTPPATQVALLEGLAQRGGAAAAPAVMSAAKSPAPAVRIAAFEALGTLGGASAAALLAEAAASTEGAEQKVARQALIRLRRGNVTEAILAHLPKATPAVQAELVRALGYRRDASAVAALLKMAAGRDESIGVAAMRALALLGDESIVDELVALLVRAKAEAVCEAIEKSLVSICGRSKRPQALATLVLAARKGASVPARCALLRVAGRIGGAKVLQALRAGVHDQSAAIRDAAIRTMAETAGIEAAGDLLKLAREAAEAPHRVLALRGYWRLVAAAGNRTAEQRLKMCEAGLAAAVRPAEKKLALAELAKVPHLGALKLAETLCGARGVRAEAEAACVRIAASLGSAHPAEAKAALRRVLTGSKNPSVRAEAQKALDAMEQYVGYITAWAVAGPYRQKGKECHQLFDIAFAPELPAAKAVWRPLPPPADASLFWQADVSRIVGGNHCVVYLRTRVYAPTAGRVRLDIGTDDGIKLWVGGKLVHANNAIRGLTPGQDKAQCALKQGWNDFLLKITQHTMGCGACVRIRSLNGSAIKGLRFDSGAPPGR